MLYRVFLILALVSGHFAFAQQDNCKVLMPSISGSYGGDCKNGLAQGRGIAMGTDHYEGKFIKGLPSGSGKYTWADGTYYEGQWNQGMREGKGKMVYRDSTLNGFWQADKYIGNKLKAPYKIISSLSVSRYTITKVSGMGNDIKMKIMQGGRENMGVEDFSLLYDSGDEYRTGMVYGIQNVRFPVEVKVKYRSWNPLKTSQYDVIFEFSIEQPGNWNVMISN